RRSFRSSRCWYRSRYRSCFRRPRSRSRPSRTRRRPTRARRTPGEVLGVSEADASGDLLVIQVPSRTWTSLRAHPVDGIDGRGGSPVSCSSSDSSGRGAKFGYAPRRIWRSCVDGEGGKMKAFGLADEGAPAAVIEVPTPEPGPGEVRVKVRASSVNGFDVFVAKGMARGMMEHRYPVVIGKDIAGEIDALGEGASGFALGDEVAGIVPTEPHLWLGPS